MEMQRRPNQRVFQIVLKAKSVQEVCPVSCGNASQSLVQFPPVFFFNQDLLWLSGIRISDQLGTLHGVLAGEQIIQALTRELKDLAFANSEFAIHTMRLPEIGPNGYDAMEYMISTNPGEPLRPLSRIASGGEISRIMLAFKHIIGDNDSVETMIFDEIDTGISGKTALVVGKKMREISEHHQILCITHLPQIAAYGNSNFRIQKSLSENSTHTDILRLDEDGKIHMLAGMISGDPDSASALDAARELNASAAVK